MPYRYRPNHPMANENGMVDTDYLIDEPTARSALPAPMVVSDSIDALRHHGTGEILDSKSAFRKRNKELGYVEIGNEKPKGRRTPAKLDRQQRKNDIRKAIYQLKNGKRP